MNNFPAMTEAQRQELIKYLIGAIEAIDLDCALGWRINAQYRLPFQIALAALTAKPDITVLFDKHRREGNVMPNYNEMPTVVSCNWKPDGEHRYYTAPPAPVLRVPDGWQLVPIEPTEDMLAAAKEWFGLTTTAEGVYEKMLDAAPEASNEQ